MKDSFTGAIRKTGSTGGKMCCGQATGCSGQGAVLRRHTVRADGFDRAAPDGTIGFRRRLAALKPYLATAITEDRLFRGGKATEYIAHHITRQQAGNQDRKEQGYASFAQHVCE